MTTLTVKEYAEWCGMSITGVYRQIHTDSLPDGVKSKKIGKATYLIEVSESFNKQLQPQ